MFFLILSFSPKHSIIFDINYFLIVTLILYIESLSYASLFAFCAFRVFRIFNIAFDSSRMFWIFLLVFFVFPHFFFVFRPSSFILRSSSSFIFHYLDQRLQPNIVVLRQQRWCRTAGVITNNSQFFRIL